MRKVCQCEQDVQICPREVATYIPKGRDIKDVRTFFTVFTEMELEGIFNISVGTIIRLLERLEFTKFTFVERCDALTDLFVESLLERREELLTPETEEEYSTHPMDRRSDIPATVQEKPVSVPCDISDMTSFVSEEDDFFCEFE